MNGVARGSEGLKRSSLSLWVRFAHRSQVHPVLKRLDPASNPPVPELEGIGVVIVD